MKQDVLDALSGRFPQTIPSKETLNHPELITRLVGFDVYEDTDRAYEIAWRKLGIDIHAGLRGQAYRFPVAKGSYTEGNRRIADLGVFPTGTVLDHQPHLDKTSDEWIYQYDPQADDINVEEQTIIRRKANCAFRERFGDLAVHNYDFYTTLFMWPVMTFGWEAFMLNASLDPERFDRTFWEPWSRISQKHTQAMANMDEEVCFLHDDLAMGTGLVFPPAWYEKHIFSRYPSIIEPIHKARKKLVFISDGNIDAILERLLEFPIDAIMFENPATPFDRVLDTWGKAGRGFIGGICTAILTCGSPEDVRQHTLEVIEQGRRYPGFIISSCGGLHGNIPYENILAYFETRNKEGIPADLEGTREPQPTR